MYNSSTSIMIRKAAILNKFKRKWYFQNNYFYQNFLIYVTVRVFNLFLFMIEIILFAHIHLSKNCYLKNKQILFLALFIIKNSFSEQKLNQKSNINLKNLTSYENIGEGKTFRLPVKTHVSIRCQSAWNIQQVSVDGRSKKGV